MLFFLNVHKNSFLRIMNNTITSDFEEVSINLQKEYEEEKEIDQVQIKLSSKIFKIPKINLFKFSVCLRDNCDYKTVGEFFSRKIQLYTERFKIKESSIQTFLEILQGNDAKIICDQYCDLSKLSDLLNVTLLQKCLQKYALLHSKDVEFNVNLILDRINETEFNQNSFSANAEEFLCNNINNCIKNEQFWKLPISTLYRIIEKSDSQKITSDLLCEFIMKSIEERHVLFSFIKLQDLSDTIFDELYRNSTKDDKSSKYYAFIKNDLAFVKKLKETNKSLETKVNMLIKSQNEIKKDQIQAIDDKNKLNEKLNINIAQKEEIQSKFNQIFQEKQKLEEDLINIQEEKRIIFQKHQNLSRENDILLSKNKELQNENMLLHEKQNNIYYDIVDTLFVTNDNVNELKLSDVF